MATKAITIVGMDVPITTKIDHLDDIDIQLIYKTFYCGYWLFSVVYFCHLSIIDSSFFMMTHLGFTLRFGIIFRAVIK